MATAIEQIVALYVRIGDRRALEEMRMHRQRMAVDLKSRSGFDFSHMIEIVSADIAAIDAGLNSLGGMALAA